MHEILTQFGASGGGAGSLGISLSGFLIQLLTFIIAFLILRKWAFKPIMRIMDERRAAIEKGVTLGEQMQKEKDELEAKVSSALSESRKKADQIIADAQQSARSLVKDAEDQARSKAELILRDAETKSKQEIERAWRELESQLADLVTDATEAVVEEKVDKSKDAALINKAIKEQVKA